MKKENLYNLPIQFNQEEDWVVAHCPALELVSQGKDLDEARKNIAEVIDLYLEDLKTPEILEQALTELGWYKKADIVGPPETIASINFPIRFPTFSYSH